jgi:hypothetical protein
LWLIHDTGAKTLSLHSSSRLVASYTKARRRRRWLATLGTTLELAIGNILGASAGHRDLSGVTGLAASTTGAACHRDT